VHARAVPVVCSFRHRKAEEKLRRAQGTASGAHAEQVGPGKNKCGQSEAKHSIFIQYCI
jgi:hypothetical protein